MSFRPFVAVLHTLADAVDDASNAPSAHVAPSAGVRQPATRRNDEATLDQLHRVEGAEQVCGAVDTLEPAHRSQAPFQIAVVSLAAVGRDHPVVEAGRGVLGVGRPRADGAGVEGRLVGDDVLGGTPSRFNRSPKECFSGR